MAALLSNRKLLSRNTKTSWNSQKQQVYAHAAANCGLVYLSCIKVAESQVCLFIDQALQKMQERNSHIHLRPSRLAQGVGRDKFDNFNCGSSCFTGTGDFFDF